MSRKILEEIAVLSLFSLERDSARTPTRWERITLSNISREQLDVQYSVVPRPSLPVRRRGSARLRQDWVGSLPLAN